MKLTISQDNLIRAIERCGATTDARSAHPYTGKVRISAVRHEDGQECMQAYATDLITQVDTAVDAKVEETGEAGVDCKRLLQVAHAMPSGMVTLMHRQDRLVVSCRSKRSYGLPSIPTDLFPPHVEPGEGSSRLPLKSELLRTILKRVGHSLSQGTQEHLRGVYIDASDGTISGVAVGSYVATALTTKCEEAVTWSALLPLVMIKLIELLCLQSERLTLIKDGSQVFVETDDTLVGGILPRGEYPPWRNVLEGLQRAKVGRVHSLEFQDMLKAVCAGRSPEGIILIEVDGESLRCTLRGDTCQAQDEIDVEPLDGGTKTQWLLTPEYILDAVKGADADFLLEDSTQGPVITTDDGYFSVVAVRLEDVELGASGPKKTRGKKAEPDPVYVPEGQE